jgi:hypothetical protein
MRRRGATLLTTLVWLALMAGAAFSLASLSVQHLTAAAVQENRAQALDLARSAVSLGISRVVANTDFGKSSGPRGDVLVVQPGEGPSGAAGYLTFDPDKARELGLRTSTNNLEGSTSVQGADGQAVPKNSVVLIGEGRCGGVVRRVEATLAVPPFPYALASAGPVIARRGVTIAGVRAGVTAGLGPGAELVPANLLSNDEGADAVVLGPGTKVTGDVSAVGSVQLDQRALQDGNISIEGRVTSGAAREKIPHIPLASYDPQVGQAAFTTLASASLSNGPAVLGGAFRRQGDLSISQGLRLEGGVLYVHGDLHIRGGITGRGMVVTTGNLRVEGQTDFRSGSGVAVLSGKDLTISGSGAEGSYFQGLVYTEGSFTADKVTLLGTMIAAGENNRRQVVLDNARVIHDRSGGPLNIVSPPPPTTPLVMPSVVTAPIHPGESCQANFELVQGKWNVTITITDVGTSQSIAVQRVLGTTREEVAANLADALLGLGRPSPSGEAMIREWVGEVMAQAQGGETPDDDNDDAGAGGGATITTLDPSQFLHLAERIRVVLWNEF